MYATVQAYNRQGNIYLNDKEYCQLLPLNCYAI